MPLLQLLVFSESFNTIKLTLYSTSLSRWNSSETPHCPNGSEGVDWVGVSDTGYWKVLIYDRHNQAVSKSITCTGLDRPWRFQEGEEPTFQDNRHMKTGNIVSPTHRPPLLPPRIHSWCSFLLESKSTPVLWCGRKDYVNEKFPWHHQESNPRPFGL